MPSILEQASITFNQVMSDHSVKFSTSPLDFSIGEKCILPALNYRGEILANKLFDQLFPPLDSGIYYNYMNYGAFEKIMETGNLRLFSTKKLCSEGEFIPLCQDLELDGYWRIGSDGNPEGEYASMMDDLFYKSFVSSPEDNADQLWKTFASNGTGVRIAVEITIHSNYPDFRRISYQESRSVEILESLIKSFRKLKYHFIPFGISRMPAYCQLKEFAYQNECRLIAKRHPGAHDCFPFYVDRDKKEQCNYIDCSLQVPTCSGFQLRLASVEPGPSCDNAKLNEVLKRFTWANLPCA